ncbi:uncharacterized protein [Palaemon carinicauda]|uniref:uncharacterized protein n=1 Tax=Palaemon carinicauda TaxID=392227 RepID=UPI0035B5DA2C
MISGDYGPGYLYGNVKTHKQGNPLRPIISQCPTPKYQLAKKLNTILTPYVPNRHCVSSSAEYLERIKDVRGEGVIASMDVESLFTNVPVDESIDILADKIYREETNAELNIPEHALRTLPAICTKRAPFTTHRGHMYLQKDGVAMGSSLCVLFANFYMGVVEERVFSQLECPVTYFRNIDDTFVKATSTEAIENLIRTFEDNSILHFTLENSVDNSLTFLDVLISSTKEGFQTTVYTKPTNLGMCLNGESECPARYRASTISAFVCRGFSHCSSWIDTHKELERAAQTEKTRSLIMRNNPAPCDNEPLKKTIEVYSYQCLVQGCHGKYIGMTTTKLSKGISCHVQQGALRNHALQRHNIQISRAGIVDNTNIIGSTPDSRRLQILEALLIHNEKPAYNTTQEMFFLPSFRPTNARN